MTDNEAFEAWFKSVAKYTQPQDMDAWMQDTWHAALAWLRSQAEPVAWITEDGDRCVTALTYNGAKKDGGATWSSMRPYSVPLYLAPQPAIPDGWLERGKSALEECRRSEDLWSDDRLLALLFNAMTSAPEPRK